MIEDDIYEAGVVPELWPQVIETIAQLAGAAGGFLFTLTATGPRWVTSDGIAEEIEAYFAGGYQLRDERTRRLLARDHAGFSVDLDVFTKDEWEADPVRREFLVPRGYGWGIATGIGVPTGETLIFHCEKQLAKGPVDRAAIARLDALRPHLARAALMSSRLELQRAVGTVAGLELLGLPAAVLAENGSLRVANGPFEALVPEVVLDHRAGIALAHPPADLLLQAALQALSSGASVGAMSVPLPAGDGRPAMIVHLSPVRGAAHDIFARASVVLVITPLAIGEVASAKLLQGLFDLTPTEARVARALGAGSTLEAVAAAHGVATHTVRNQLRSIFSKTGVNRQADLVGLLAGTPMPVPANGGEEGGSSR